jgi:hypothetical protein
VRRRAGDCPPRADPQRRIERCTRRAPKLPATCQHTTIVLMPTCGAARADRVTPRRLGRDAGGAQYLRQSAVRRQPTAGTAGYGVAGVLPLDTQSVFDAAGQCGGDRAAALPDARAKCARPVYGAKTGNATLMR